MLAWGALNYMDGFRKAGEAENMKSNLKWGADYYMAAHTSKYVLVAQVKIVESFLGEGHSHQLLILSRLAMEKLTTVGGEGQRITLTHPDRLSALQPADRVNTVLLRN